MPGPTPSTSTQVVENKLPAWVDQAGQANYNEAVRIGEKPLEQYPGSTVAPMSQTTQQAISFFKDALPGLGADTAEASSIFRTMNDPEAMTSRIQSLLNPYIDNVENKALSALDRARTQALMANADKAIASKAFGGSRSAIVDAVTNAEFGNQAGILSAGLRKEGFDTASALAKELATTAGQGLLATGEQKQSSALKNLTALLQLGQTEQGQAQRELDADVAKFLERRDKDIADLNLRLATLGMTPYSTTQTTNTTSTEGSRGFDPATLILGLLSIGLGL